MLVLDKGRGEGAGAGREWGKGQRTRVAGEENGKGERGTDKTYLSVT